MYTKTQIPKTHISKSHLSQSGFTLVEALISMTILVTIAVPLFGFVFRNTEVVEMQKAYMGQCILEQEALHIQMYPDDYIPEKKRTVQGKEWTIKTDKTGKGVSTYTMTVFWASKLRANAVFFGKEHPDAQ